MRRPGIGVGRFIGSLLLFLPQASLIERAERMKNYFCEMTEREREIANEIRRENIKEIIGCLILVPIFLFLAAAYLVITPNQRSAEADRAAIEMEAEMGQ